MNKLAAHVSGIQKFQECQRKWYYSDRKWGLGYTTAGTSDSMLLGTWMHYALALVLQGVDYKTAVEITMARQYEFDPYSDTTELEKRFTNLMMAHQLWQFNDKTRYADRNLQSVYIEQEVEFKMEDKQFGLIWDRIVRHNQTGELYVFERKVTKAPDDMQLGVQWDYQPRLYVLAAETLLEERVAGVIYELIKNTDPFSVKMLQNGLPSKAQTELAGTTYEVYSEVLIKAAQEQGLEVEKVLQNYAPQLDQLSLNTSPIFRRTLVPISQGQREATRQQMIRLYDEMSIAKEYGELVTPTLNRHGCNSRFNPCPFRDVCLAQDDGADWRELLEMSFVKDQERFDSKLPDAYCITDEDGTQWLRCLES